MPAAKHGAHFCDHFPRVAETVEAVVDHLHPLHDIRDRRLYAVKEDSGRHPRGAQAADDLHPTPALRVGVDDQSIDVVQTQRLDDVVERAVERDDAVELKCGMEPELGVGIETGHQNTHGFSPGFGFRVMPAPLGP